MPRRAPVPKIDPQVSKARRAFQAGHFEEAKALALNAAKKAKARKDDLNRVEALSVLSDVLRDSKDTGGAIAAIEEAIAIAEKTDLLFSLCDIIRKRAFLFLVQSQYPQADDYARKALRIARDNGFGPHEADALALIGHLCEVRKERPRALVWFREAMKIAKSAKHVWRQSGLHHDLGRINGELQNYTAGLDYLDQGERFATQHGFKKHILLILRAKADIYKAIGDTGRARELYERSFAPAFRAGTPFEEMENAVRLGAINLDDGQIEQAAKHYRRGIELGEQFGYGRTVLQNRFGLGMCHIRQNEYLVAYECFSALLQAVKGDCANNLSTARSALEQVAYLLHKLDRPELAYKVEGLERRFKNLDDEGTYTVPQKNAMREELIGELPQLVQDISKMQFEYYEAFGLRVNVESGAITVGSQIMEEPLKGSELTAFRFLFKNLGHICTAKAIHDEYRGEEIDAKAMSHRVYTVINEIRKKGISTSVLKTVPKKGYLLVTGGGR